VAVAHYFGEKLIKSGVGTSNWANPRLDERQLLYAANDAHVALKIYHAWLADPSRHAATHPGNLMNDNPPELSLLETRILGTWSRSNERFPTPIRSRSMRCRPDAIRKPAAIR
jgi:hypothetical protein